MTDISHIRRIEAEVQSHLDRTFAAIRSGMVEDLAWNPLASAKAMRAFADTIEAATRLNGPTDKQQNGLLHYQIHSASLFLATYCIYLGLNMREECAAHDCRHPDPIVGDATLLAHIREYLERYEDLLPKEWEEAP